MNDAIRDLNVGLDNLRGAVEDNGQTTALQGIEIDNNMSVVECGMLNGSYIKCGTEHCFFIAVVHNTVEGNCVGNAATHGVDEIWLMIVDRVEKYPNGLIRRCKAGVVAAS